MGADSVEVGPSESPPQLLQSPSQLRRRHGEKNRSSVGKNTRTGITTDPFMGTHSTEGTRLVNLEHSPPTYGPVPPPLDLSSTDTSGTSELFSEGLASPVVACCPGHSPHSKTRSPSTARLCENMKNGKRTRSFKKMVSRQGTVEQFHIGKANSDSPPLLLKGAVESKVVRILLDSGASHSFCTQTVVPKNLKCDSDSSESFCATMVDGSSLKIGKSKKFTLTMGALRWTHEFFPTEINNYDFILGRDWFQRFNPQIDWTKRVVKVYLNCRWQSLPLWDGVEIAEISSRRLGQTLAKGELCYAVLVNSVESAEEEAIPPVIDSLIKDYNDIFPSDLPSGLPPKRDEDHHIILESWQQPTCQTSLQSQPC